MLYKKITIKPFDNTSTSLSVNNLAIKSFTILELTIVVAIIGLIAVAMFVLLNPFKQIQKSQDTKRKHELTQVSKVLEDYYNDKGCYPKPTELCYDNAILISDNTYTCHICGHHQMSPPFSPYLSRLPCDPQYSSKNYLYQVDNNTCPTWFRIFSQLSNREDQDSLAIGCITGCGVRSTPPDYKYLYAVKSPNIGLDSCVTSPQIWYRNMESACNICKPLGGPDSCNYLRPIYIDEDCLFQCGNN